jgi:hypothetical protein
MLQRVGPIIDEETQGHRTPEFGTWWRQTKSDLRLVYLTDVRNAEFKRGEDRKSAHHHVCVEETVAIADSVQATVMRDGKIIQDGSGGSSPAVKPAPAPSSHSVEWIFRGGSHDGHDVMALLRQHLDWLRDTVLPTAERLTGP